MLHKERVVNAIGIITRIYALAFLLPALASLVYDVNNAEILGIQVPLHFAVFLLVAAISGLIGTLLVYVAGETNNDLGSREAYLTVGVGWLLLCVLTSLPFMLGGTLPNFGDALFEAMSGLTTTGASVIPDLEVVAPSVHVWRTFTQFLGGMGIIVLSVAVLSRLTQGGLQMLQAEVPGPTLTRSTPRIAQAMRGLWRVYLGWFGLVFAALLLDLLARHDYELKQAAYEAMIHSFATVSTGGFSNHSASIAFFNDPLLEFIIILGMLAAGTNFALILTGKGQGWRKLLQEGELRLYAGLFVGASSTIAFLLMRSGASWVQSIRDAPFVVTSMMTSTGFVTADYVAWPQAAQMAILFIMVGGAMAGSTSGGVKLVRILLLWKVMTTRIRKALHPRATTFVRINHQVVKDRTLMAVSGFFISFIGLWILGTLALSVVEPSLADVISAASASLSALSNVGPGLGAVGPTENFSGLSMTAKAIVTGLMWLGRLEIFTAIMILLPGTWKH